MSGWVVLAWLTWPLYCVGIRRPYGWVSGKAATQMLRQMQRAER